MPRDIREAIMRSILEERLSTGWGRGPELLQVYGTIMGHLDTEQTMVAISGEPFIESWNWANAPVLDVLEATAQVVSGSGYQEVRRPLQDQAAAQSGVWLGVMFICEATVQQARDTEMLVATFVGGAGEWASVQLIRGDDPQHATELYSENSPAFDAEVIEILRRIAVEI